MNTFQNAPGADVPGPRRYSRAVFIGASSGGVYAMLDLAATLPADFPVPLFLVQHIGAYRSQLAQLLTARGPNPAVEASDGETPLAGTIYVAPPDHHMLLESGLIRVRRGPKEHHARPAIDPLFRSAALEMGAGAIGVVLTGLLDDGSAGVRAIKDCGGSIVVQDPADAFEPSMPRAALAVVRADHVAPISKMADVLLSLARADIGAAERLPHEPPPALRREHAVAEGGHTVEQLKEIATPSMFSCPDCGGVLFELDDKRPVRYRCHTGHAFSLRSLASNQEQVADAAMWTSLRVLQEKEAILRRLADAQRVESPEAAAECDEEADEIAAVAAAMRRLALKTPSPSGFES